jgi:hypothetical protein
VKTVRNGKSDRMRDAERQRRNLDAHAPARAATWLFGERYAAQRGGIMDFWDTLDAPEKRMARTCAEELRTARRELPGEEGAP